MNRIIIASLLLGSLIGCEGQVDEESFENTPSGLYKRIQASDSYEEAKPFLPERIHDLYSKFELDKQEVLFQNVIKLEDYNLEERVKGNKALLLIYGGTTKTPMCAYSEKNSEGKWEFKRLFGGLRSLAFDSYDYSDPEVFRKDATFQFENEKIATKYIIAEQEDNGVTFEFREKYTKGDLELDMMGSTDKDAQMGERMIIIHIQYDKDQAPTSFSINYVGFTRPGETIMQSVSSDRAIKDFELKDKRVKLIASVVMTGFGEREIGWDIDIDTFMLETKCAHVFKNTLSNNVE